MDRMSFMKSRALALRRDRDRLEAGRTRHEMTRALRETMMRALKGVGESVFESGMRVVR